MAGVGAGVGADAAGPLPAIDEYGARDEYVRYLLPKDLMEFGLIPEFIGRLPVVATLDTLRRQELVRILVEPKNALVRQFQRLFVMNGKSSSSPTPASTRSPVSPSSARRGARPAVDPRGHPARSALRATLPQGHRPLRGRRQVVRGEVQLARGMTAADIEPTRPPERESA